MKKIHQGYKNLSPEKKLALKISGVSFVILSSILWAIVAVSYYSQLDRTYREFSEEIAMFESGRIGKGIREVFDKESDMVLPPVYLRDMKDDGGRERGPRDILIFDKDHMNLKNDYLDLDDAETTSLFGLSETGNSILEIDGHKYLIYRKGMGDYTFFLTRDLTQLIDFHESLMILAGAGSILGLIIIYFLSIHLARLVIEPIREHNASLTAYSHNVAHELKTPLAVMRSNMELLKLAPSEKLISSTEEEVTSMEHIIDTLLLLANPAKHIQENEKIELISFSEKILENYDDAEIVFIQPKKKIYLECSPEFYKRVFTNLLENAIKYKSGGEVTIELQANSLTIKNNLNADISEGELRKLTETFYQSDTSRGSSGQGLGLALVQKIVDTSGWRLALNSGDRIFTAEITF